jgi:hypothetical protein
VSWALIGSATIVTAWFFGRVICSKAGEGDRSGNS